MAQQQLDKIGFKIKNKHSDVTTQTGDIYGFVIYLTGNKIARVYYSEAYKDYVLSFNYGTCKKFIVTRAMWKIIMNNMQQLNNVFS